MCSSDLSLWYLFFSFWLTLLHVIISRSIHVAANGIKICLLHKDPVVGWIIALQRHVLISRTCEHITLHGKGILKMWLNWGSCEEEMILDYLGGSNVIPRVLLRKKLEGQRAKSEEEVRVRWDHERRNRSSPWSWKRQGNILFPRAFRKNTALQMLFTLLTSRILR